MTSEATGHVAFDMAGVVAAIAGSSSNFRRLQQRVADELRDSYLGNSSTASNSNGSSKGEEGDDAQILAEYILHLLVKENASVDRLSEELKEFLGPPVRSSASHLFKRRCRGSSVLHRLRLIVRRKPVHSICFSYCICFAVRAANADSGFCSVVAA